MNFIGQPPPFTDRRAAGRFLAVKLSKYANRDDVLVLALPRGGVPVGYEVAIALRVLLDVFVVRKLGLPGYEELAMGALASGGIRVLNDDVMRQVPNADELIETVVSREKIELERREKAYRDGRPSPDLHGKTMILVDDGLATGASMRAAAGALKQRDIARLIVAVPVAAIETSAELKLEVDEIICGITPENFHGVGQFYEDFSQTSDEEVRALLADAAQRLQDRQPG
jgi:putative phosphoribosyl transferase